MNFRSHPFLLLTALLALSLSGTVALTWYLSSHLTLSVSPHLGKAPESAESRFAHAMRLMQKIDSDATTANLKLPDQLGQWPALIYLVDQTTNEWNSLTKDYPELPEPFSNLAVAYTKKGQYFQASDALLEGLHYHPQHQTLVENLKSLDRFVLSLPLDHPLRKNQTEQIRNALEKWRMGWATRNVEQYFSSYSASFKPSKGLSLSDWKAQRETRVSSPSEISLNLSGVNIKLLSSYTADVSFLQIYTAGRTFLATQKRLRFVRDLRGWTIQSEEVL